MNEIELPLILADWCNTVLNHFTVLSHHSQAHSESLVWRLATDQQTLYLKAYHRPAKWGMEVHAYEHWVSALDGESPQLMAVLEEPLQAILITELPGITMNRVTLATESEQVAWQSAGSALARLHALPQGHWFGVPLRNGDSISELPDTDPVMLMQTALDNWFTRGINADLLTTREIKTVEQALMRVDVFTGDRPTPCHGDYQPRNWVVGTDGTWRGVIDFEHARWDLKMNDLGYWWDRGLLERPDLKAAFLKGYGELNEQEQVQLYIIRILGAIARINWGRQYGDITTENLGHKVLDNFDI